MSFSFSPFSNHLRLTSIRQFCDWLRYRLINWVSLRLYSDWLIFQVTHWHHPNFHAYFPTGNSYPAIMADILSDAIGCVGFSWVSKYICIIIGMSLHEVSFTPSAICPILQGIATPNVMCHIPQGLSLQMLYA